MPAVDRQSLMNRFEEYNIDFVNFMFDSCFEAEGYLSRDILNEYLRTARVTAIPKSWAYQLLMGETK